MQCDGTLRKADTLGDAMMIATGPSKAFKCQVVAAERPLSFGPDLRRAIVRTIVDRR